MENKINPIEGQLTIIDAEGTERLCQILFTLESEEFGKKYVIFYPLEQLEGEDDDQIQLMAASFTEGEDGNGELQEIETEEEWALIEDAVAEFEESMEQEHHCGCGCGHECGEGECEGECDGECECEQDGEEHHCGCGHCHHHDE